MGWEWTNMELDVRDERFHPDLRRRSVLPSTVDVRPAKLAIERLWIKSTAYIKHPRRLCRSTPGSCATPTRGEREDTAWVPLLFLGRLALCRKRVENRKGKMHHIRIDAHRLTRASTVVLHKIHGGVIYTKLAPRSCSFLPMLVIILRTNLVYCLGAWLAPR